MSNVSDEVSALQSQICEHWNRAEKSVKRAEQLVGEAVMPAILELRYAGRRMVEAHDLLQGDDEELHHEALNRLQDASYNCQRANHDAVDAAVATISIHIEEVRKRISAKKLIKAFPEFPELIKALENVYSQIRDARENREERNDIYTNLDTNGYKALEDYYSVFKSHPKILSLIVRSRWTFLSGWIVAFLLFLIQNVFGIALGEIWDAVKPETWKSP